MSFTVSLGGEIKRKNLS